jgi:pilus assembly protein CpaD
MLPRIAAMPKLLSFKPVLLLAAALPLAACGGTVNRGVESVHQPVVSRADYLLDLATPGGRLAPGEPQRLAGWLTGLRLGYGDRVSIDDPALHGPAVRDAVAGVVARYGLLLSDEAPVSPAPVEPGTVRVVVSRMQASVPHCPDWSRDSSIDYDQNTSSNYGCATNTNLAAMVANPQDLVRGASGSDLTDQTITSRAIGSFRKAPVTVSSAGAK